MKQQELHQYLTGTLEIKEGESFILCPDDPCALTEDMWRLAARVLHSWPRPRIVFYVPHEQMKQPEARKELRNTISKGLWPFEPSLTGLAVFMCDEPSKCIEALLPDAVCLIQLTPAACERETGQDQIVEEGVPMIIRSLPEPIRQAMGASEAERSSQVYDPDDAFVELVMNIVAGSPHGVELKKVLPHRSSRSSNEPVESRVPLLLDLEADEEATIELCYAQTDGQQSFVHSMGLDVREQVDAYYGSHRSGWAYATDVLRYLHNPSAPYFETFLERRFSWGAWMGEQLGPICKPWLGIVHVPLEIPGWFGQSNTFTEIARTESWKMSAPYCRGLFTLTRSLLESLREVPELRDMPMDVLTHPTEFVASTWSPDDFASNEQRALVQVGSSYRNLHGIHCVPSGPYQKWIATGGNTESFQSLYFQEEASLIERGLFTPGLETHTIFLEYLDNDAFDAVFIRNVIFAEYYAASATNLVLECIARNTPILVNPLPAIVEYLGQDYPLYFNSYEEAGEKAADMDLIMASHQYLASIEKGRFTRESFVEDILNSPLYQQCPRM